jgi:hypothetical protein
MDSSDRLFCLACGDELPDCLRHVAALRCHDCRDAAAPIEFELVWLARELTLQADGLPDDLTEERRAA